VVARAVAAALAPTVAAAWAKTSPPTSERQVFYIVVWVSVSVSVSVSVWVFVSVCVCVCVCVLDI
jgi:hypothetical protein